MNGILDIKIYSDYLEAEFGLSKETIDILIQAIELDYLTPRQVDIIIELANNK